jgi:hypothetical protein
MAALGFAYRGIGRMRVARFAAMSAAANARTRESALRNALLTPAATLINAVSGV